MDVSVTIANLKNASFQWGCNLVEESSSLQWSWGSVQSVTGAKREGLLGAGQLRDKVCHKLADMTQSACAILLSSSSIQCWRSFFSLQRFWCQAFWSYFFPAQLRTSQYLLLSLCSRCQITVCEHFTLPGTMICANVSFTFQVCLLDSC